MMTILWIFVARRVDAAGDKVGPARTLVPFSVVSSTVTFNPRTSQYLLLWSTAPSGSDVFDPDAPSTDVFGQLLNGDGTPSGPPFAVTAANGSQAFGSAAANSATGRHLVVWEDARTSAAAHRSRAPAVRRGAEPVHAT